VKIVFDIYGDRDAPDRAVLIHSLAMDRAYWRPVAERLMRKGICVAALDCRGHGASGKPTGPYTIASFAGDVRALLDSLRWPEAVIAGSSMGGSVALAFAIDYGERASGLALIDTTAWYGPDAPKNWAERADAAREKGLASLVAFQTTRWFGDAFRTDHADVVQACVGIVVGEEDYATPPAMAEAMKAAISQATYRLLPNARHLTPLERSDEVTEEILAVIGKARGAASRRL
jgi:3-oxoadipate enol-lactonase